MRIRKSLCIALLSASLGGVGAFAQEHGDSQDHHDSRDHQDDRDHHDEHDSRYSRDSHEDRDRHENGDHHDNHAYVRHSEWRRGERIRREDWDRGERVDYRSRRLEAPPRGYEWREVDGNYILAAVATGVIASVIAASANR